MSTIYGNICHGLKACCTPFSTKPETFGLNTIAASIFILSTFILSSFILSGCAHHYNVPFNENDLKILVNQSKTHYVEELSQDIAIFDHVAVGLGLPLRRYLSENQNVKNKSILDLGTGSGVLSLIALKNGASKTVATDINPYAVANAVFNSERMGFKDKMSVRLVSMEKQGAYAVINNQEQFDLIISNPPQGDTIPAKYYDYSHADPNLAFLKSIIAGLNDRLTPQGKGVFALYDQGLKLANDLADKYNLEINILLKTHNKSGDYYVVELKKNADLVQKVASKDDAGRRYMVEP